mgnify:CR=1 FL=1
MHAQHPTIAAKWDAEMKKNGDSVPKKEHKSQVKSAAQKSLGGRYA